MLPHYPKINIILKSYTSFINFNFLVKSKYLFLFDFFMVVYNNYTDSSI